MNPEDIKKSPKLFAENIKLGYTQEYVILAISSGASSTTYALTPAHAKRLKQYLEHELAAFEEKHGDIKAEWNPNIVSPMQRGNPPTDES